MKSLEEIKSEITNNSYPVELSNGQIIYIDRVTSSKVIFAYVKDDKNPYGFRKVVSIPKDLDKKATIERIEDYADNIKMPSLLNYKSTSECNNACSSLIEEIANALLNEPITEDILSIVETGEVYSRFKEEIESLKKLDIEFYNSYIIGVYNRKKRNEDPDVPATSDFSLTHHHIMYLLHALSKSHDIGNIKQRIEKKWDWIDIDD